MTSCAEGHHTAFVIMPYGDTFDELYEKFIVTVLSGAGFAVTRADEAISSTRIMANIIHGIEESCIVVADLTGGNANVFYELGLAHALHKPVIHLTQDVKGLPFDISGYQVIPYDRDFVPMGKAQHVLAEVAAGVLGGKTAFGNPYSDHIGKEIIPSCSTGRSAGVEQRQEQQRNGESGPLGFLDHQTAMEEGFETIRGSTEEIAIKTAQVDESMRRLTTELNATQGVRGPRQTQQRLKLIRGLALEMDGYADFLSTANGEYSDAVDRSRLALEAMLAASQDSPNDIQDLLSTLDTVEQQVVTFHETTNTVATVISELPDVESSFMRARDRVVDQLRQLAGNIARIVAMIVRTRELARLKSRAIFCLIFINRSYCGKYTFNDPHKI